MKFRLHIFLIISLIFIFGCSMVQQIKYPDLPKQCTIIPKNTGGCQANFRLYYYEPSTDSCEIFHYGGCGTAPPFRTLIECHTTCIQRFGPEKELSDEDIRYELDYLRSAYQGQLDYAYEQESYINSLLSGFPERKLGLFQNQDVFSTFITFPDNKIRTLVLFQKIQDTQTCLNKGGRVIENPSSGEFLGCAPKLGFPQSIERSYPKEALERISKCEVFMEDSKCFGNIALDFNNPKLCKIPNELYHNWGSKKNGCIEYFIEIKPDPQICNDIDDYNLRADCWNKLQEVKPSIETCEASMGRKDSCLQELAYKQNDSSLCYKLTNGESECIRSYGVDDCFKTPDYECCHLRNFKDECIVWFAGKGDFGYEECKQVEKDNHKEDCILSLSPEQLPANPCEIVNDPKYKKSCIRAIAIKLSM